VIGAGDLVWDDLLALEPGTHTVLTNRELDAACETIADYADIKSPFLLGHSTGVAYVVGAAAPRFGLGEEECAVLRRSALLHDIGRAGVSAGIWGKSGPLSEADWEKIRRSACAASKAYAWQSAFSSRSSSNPR